MNETFLLILLDFYRFSASAWAEDRKFGNFPLSVLSPFIFGLSPFT